MDINRQYIGHRVFEQLTTSHRVELDMSDNSQLNLCFMSSDETDSADETFLFKRKRKADPFFIDLTDGQPEAKKKRRHLDGSVQLGAQVDQPNVINVAEMSSC